MSGGYACSCKERQKAIKDRNWVIRHYKCNYSAFSGYRQTWSEYSLIECKTCNSFWRTRAGYVYELSKEAQ